MLLFVLLYLTVQQQQQQDLYINRTSNQLGQDCIKGVVDCRTNKLLCEFGYFLFTDINSLNYCLPCPYFLTQDELNILCADCLENPYNWQIKRECTYNYRIQTGDKSDVYLRENVTTQVYYIQEKTTFQYQLVICEGCGKLCNIDIISDESTQIDEIDEVNYDEGNNVDEGNYDESNQDEGSTCLSNQQMDSIYTGMYCQDYFYYNQENGLCFGCPLHCKQCDMNSFCTACSDGYYVDITKSCKQCMDNCEKCELYEQDDEQILVCTQCMRSNNVFYIESQDLLKCQECDYYCKRCELIYYGDDYIDYGTRNKYFDEDLEYISRCRQCISKEYFISFDGIQCEECQITDCLLCYYKFDDGATTLDYDFIPQETAEGIFCKICKPGFYLSEDEQECNEITETTDCGSYYEGDNDVDKCTNCYQNEILKIQDNKCVKSKQCNKKIQNCLECYEYNKQIGDSETQQNYQCIKCEEGFYPDIFSGNCLNCPPNCITCSQYTMSYNFTSFLQTFPILSETDHYAKFILEQLEDIQCSECTYGYMLQNNVCYGCSANCYNDTIDFACYQDYDSMFCYRCQDLGSQSLISDLSECQECPDYCAACRDRTSEDPIVNRYFNPSSDRLNKYGRLCYKLYIPEVHPPLLPPNVFLDSYLGLPVLCSDQSYKFCYNTYKLQLQLDCDDEGQGLIKLSQFYSKQKTSIVIIKFNEDSISNYQLLNQNTIKQLDIELTMSGNTCKFKKQTIFQFSFTQNVFSLLKVNLNINQNSNNMQEWITVGLIQFKGVSSVKLNNINLSYDGSNPKLATGQFGFQLLSQDETEFYLKNVNFIKQPDNKLLINIYNPINITLDTVIFKNLNKNDQVIYCFYNLQTLSYQDIKILNVQIEDSFYNHSNFIQFSPSRAVFQYLKISNLFIQNSYFNSSSLVKSIGQQSSLYFDIENIRILFSQFQNCDIFNIDNLRISKQFSKIDFKNNKFINSRIFYLNSFQFQDIYFESNILINNSIIFTSIKEMKDNIWLQNSIRSYSFNNIRILHSSCYSINCIMYINTLINTYQILTTINIKNMEISDVSVNDIQDLQILATSAFLYLNNLLDIKLQNIIVDNTIGLTILYLSTFSQLQITKIYYDWSQSNKWRNNINPINNLIPLTFECAERKQSQSSFTYILVFIYQFKNIQIIDGQLQRQLFIDATFFYIQSYDVAYFNTTTSTSVESIKIDNIRFLNNSFVSKEKGLISGCLYIESNQQQKVSITNINFQSNHLQQIISKQSIQIATLININSPKGQVIINYLLSNYNRAINCLQGLIVIISSSLYISNCTFTYTNMIDRLWINRLEPNSIKSDDDIKSFFPILSYGTIFDITTYNASISQILVNHTYGIQQGIKLILIDYSYVIMNNIIMENLYGNLELKYSSTGGAFFIDSKLSELTLTITNLSIINSRVRTTGGCIHLEADNKNQNITIIKSIFQKCQALDTSFINVVFDVNSQFQQISLIEVQMIQNSIDLLLSNLPEIQTFEYLYLLQTSSFYTQFYGRLVIENCDIVFINYTSALYLNKIKFLSIDRLNIEYGILFYLPIINLFLQESGSQVYIGNLDIIQFIESFYYSLQSKVACEIVKSFIHQYPIQDCQQIQQIQEHYDEINDDEIYNEYNEDIFNYYESLTNKYTIKIISNIKYLIESSLIEIGIQTDYDVVQCLMDNIIYLSDQLGLINYISLFKIDSVNEYNQISIKQSSIAQNTCYSCEDGLFQIYSIQDVNEELIQIDEFSCSYNVVGYFGCLVLSYGFRYDISLFTDINTNRLLQTIDDLPHTVFIQNFQCDNNIAQAGTCININAVSTIIMDSRFTNNNASLVGGAIYFQNKNYENNLFMQNNLFSNNYAQIGGAIYLVNYQLNDVEKAGVYFDKNIADNSGNDIQENSLSLTIQLTDIPFQINTYMNLDGDYNNDNFIDNSSVIIRDNITLEYNKIGNYPKKTNLLILPSGQMISQYKYYYEQTQEQIPFQWIFRLLSLNRYGQVIKNNLPSDSCDIDGRIQNQQEYDDTIEFTNNFTIPQTIYYNYDKGGYDMDDLILIFDPKFDSNYYLELRFQCYKIYIPIYNIKPPFQIIGYNNNYELITRIRTFPCQIGEAYEAQQCKACKQNDLTYSVQYDSIQCKQINRQTMQTVSPTGIKLYKGYWRPEFHNDYIEYCINLPKNCNGGWIPGNPSCYTGHLGGLCESCDIYMIINEERWAPSGAYKCGLCKESEKYNIAIIVAISILTMISTILSVKGTFESLQLQIVLDIIQMLGRRMKSDSSNLATVVKTLTNYFQIVQIVMTFQLQIPSGVKTATETAGNPTGSMAYSLDCLLIKVSDIEVLYFKMIWALIMPLFYLGFIFIGYIFICLIGITKFSSSILYTACIYIFLYMHPTLVQGFISQASIRTISNLSFVKADIGYRYDSDLHTYWMSRFIGPMLIIWVILLPAFFMFFVWLNRKTLYTKQTKMRWGYFYREYGNDSYLWEFVKIFQKEFLVIILVYYEEFVIIKGLLIVLVLFIYGWYQISVSPFQSKKLNTTDRYSTMVCAATLCLGVLMYGAQLKDYFYLLVIILLIMAFINLWFIIQCLMQIFQGYLIQFQDQLDLLREKIIKSKPHLKEQQGFIGKLLIHRGNLNKRVKFLWELCKEKTITAVHITKLADDISFEEALSYVIQNNINSTQLISIKKNKKEFEKLNSHENE